MDKNTRWRRKTLPVTLQHVSGRKKKKKTLASITLGKEIASLLSSGAQKH